MADVFISYSRRDAAIVRRLHEALAQQNRDVWVDLEDIPPTAAWLEEIRTAIESADSFLFVISPDSSSSEVCQLELEHAVTHRKRLIPILHRETDRQAIPPALAALNWIFLRDEDDFEQALQRLVEAIETDLAWVQTHTLLLTRALEWDRKDRNESLLLRGNELQTAENNLARGAEKDPRPTELQAEYVLASRKGTTSRQRKLLAGISTALVVTVVLALVAWQQRGLAIMNEQRAQLELRIATAQNLAAQAQVAYVTIPYSERSAAGGSERGVLLALESLIAYPTIEGDLALRAGLRRLAGSSLEVAFEEDVDLIDVGPQGSWLLLATENGPRLFDVSTRAYRESEPPTAWPPANSTASAGATEQAGESSYARSADGQLYLSDAEEEGDGWVFASAAIHRARDGKRLVVLPHEWFLQFAAFSPDNQWLVTVTHRASLDAEDPAATALVGSTVRVWEVTSGRKVTEVSLAHEGGIEQVSLSRDGNWLATAVPRLAEGDGRMGDVVLLWPLWPDLLRSEACRRLTRNLSPSEWLTFLRIEPQRETCPGLPVVSE